MDQQRLSYLHQAYLDQSLNAQEQEEWENYFQQTEQEIPIKNLMDQTWQNILPEERIVLSPSKSERIFKEIVGEPKVTRISLWPRIAIAAAIATILFGAGLFFYNNNKQASTDTAVLKNDVAPGKSGATLTLANGKKIRLSEAANGELAKEAGVVITKSANGQLVYEIEENSANSNSINNLSTAKGETYQVRLPDGSMVWLNAASSLTYSANLIESGKRRVKLDGEGYFEIAKDKGHPFIVESNRQEVEVLGTHFNIHAYSDEAVVKTTLLEGTVKILSDGKQELLRPGFQATNNGNEITMDQVDTEVSVAWKNNEFMFEDQSIQSVMKMVERWYDVKIVFQGEMPPDKFGGVVSRFDNISKVLSVMESTARIHFKIQDRTVYVSR